MSQPEAVVIGQGPVGSTITHLLVEAGTRVRVLTRSGRPIEGAESISVDVTDQARTAEAVGEAQSVFMCFHAPYSARAWRALLPGMERNVLSHAAATGAAVATAESLYAFDGGPSPIRETSTWQPASRKGAVRRELLEARDASGARVLSVVAGDFYGPGVLMAHAGERLLTPVLEGGTFRPVGDPDQPHAFTYVPDLAAAMLAAVQLPGAGHEVLLAPNAGSLTLRELTALTAEAAGRPTPSIKPVPLGLLKVLGLVMPPVREIADVMPQFTRPFEVDARASEQRLGLAATPWPEAAAATVGWWRTQR